MKRDIVWTTKFKKDYKLAMKRHMDIGLLDDIIRALSRGEKLPEKNKDHALTGNWFGQERTAICSESKKMHSVSAGCIFIFHGNRKSTCYLYSRKFLLCNL